MIPRVIKIIEIKGFDVTVLFNNGKILTIDFYSWIVPRAAGKNIYTQLLKENIFKAIGCNGITLYWPDLAEVNLHLQKNNLLLESNWKSLRDLFKSQRTQSEPLSIL